MTDCTVLILAGGTGTRFWPASRRARPKQLLRLAGDRTLLEATVERVLPLAPSERIWICTTQELAPAIRELLPGIPPDQILGEPEGRNTAPAIGWSLAQMPERERQGVVASLHADHRVTDPEAFRHALNRAVELAAAGRVVALGVEPRRPDTGFGYLELGDEIGPDARSVVRFTEKPDAEAAARMAADGDHLWNAGIFVFRGVVLEEHLAAFEPELVRGLAAIAAEPERLAELYPALPKIAIDYAVMERLDELVAVPTSCGWSDLGSWEALAEVLPTDETGNAAWGDLITVEAEENVVWAESGLVALLGVEGLAVVATRDAVLVVPRQRAQEVRRIVAELERADRDELL